MPQTRFELYARIAAVALLAIGCFYVLQPFLGAIIFAAILCFSTWPIYIRLRQRMGGRSWVAALVLVGVLLFALALPVALSAQSIVAHSGQVVELFRGFLDHRSNLELPAFVQNIPTIGPWLNDYVHELATGEGELAELLKKMSDPAKNFMLAIGHGVGAGLIQVLSALFVAFFLYRDGEEVQRMLYGILERLAGPERGGALLATAQNAVRGVVYGLIGTAIVQAAVALVGFLIAGIPGAFLLGALTFVLSLVPLGPPLIWGGAAAWLYFKDETGWAIFMVIYGVFVISSVDNVIKPILMSRAGNLSMLLVVLGVFGGAFAFGFVGLFIGPALLALAWSLVKTWLQLPPEAANEPEAK
ncbi:MAG TPA: AI-2E family transporter [Usitatibacter sp.]|jgi:predicted PurR-regulated permease PerM